MRTIVIQKENRIYIILAKDDLYYTALYFQLVLFYIFWLYVENFLWIAPVDIIFFWLKRSKRLKWESMCRKVQSFSAGWCHRKG